MSSVNPVIMKIITVHYKHFLHFDPGWRTEMNWRLEVGMEMIWSPAGLRFSSSYDSCREDKKDDQWQE